MLQPVPTFKTATRQLSPSTLRATSSPSAPRLGRPSAPSGSMNWPNNCDVSSVDVLVLLRHLADLVDRLGEALVLSSLLSPISASAPLSSPSLVASSSLSSDSENSSRPRLQRQLVSRHTAPWSTALPMFTRVSRLASAAGSHQIPGPLVHRPVVNRPLRMFGTGAFSMPTAGAAPYSRAARRPRVGRIHLFRLVRAVRAVPPRPSAPRCRRAARRTSASSRPRVHLNCAASHTVWATPRITVISPAAHAAQPDALAIIRGTVSASVSQISVRVHL